MVKEAVRHVSFRYKLCIAVMCGAVILFMLRVYSVTRARPASFTSESNIVDGNNDPLQGGFSSDTLDILYIEDNFPTLDQKDPQLIQYTRIRHLTPPSKQSYNLGRRTQFRHGFSQWVAEFFKNQTNGVFIEAGANAGVEGSHTLYLEKELGWSGLLIECNPTVVPYLRSAHRKAWIADVCLSPTPNPATLKFSNPTNWTYSGTLGKPWNLPVPTKWTFFDVQAIPLYTVLAALGWKEVDYFSFDIEGQELAVLKTFPFELFKFKVLIIEIYFYTVEQKKELDDLLNANGYVFLKDMKIDKIYVHNSMIPRIAD